MAAKPKTLKIAVAKSAGKAAIASVSVQKPALAIAKNVANTASQSTAAAAAVAKPAPTASLIETPKAGTGNVAQHPTLKMKDLLDKVVAATGAKKPQTREIIEATLAVLGDALSNGDTLNLPPLGRAKVSRPSDAGSGKPMTVKLRRSSATGQGGSKGKQPLADAED